MSLALFGIHRAFFWRTGHFAEGFPNRRISERNPPQIPELQTKELDPQGHGCRSDSRIGLATRRNEEAIDKVLNSSKNRESIGGVEGEGTAALPSLGYKLAPSILKGPKLKLSWITTVRTLGVDSARNPRSLGVPVSLAGLPWLRPQVSGNSLVSLEEQRRLPKATTWAPLMVCGPFDYSPPLDFRTFDRVANLYQSALTS